MIPDPYAKTISLPVRIRNGKPEFFHAEGPLPKLKEGTIADLIVPAFAVEDKEVRAALLQKGREKLLAEGTTVLAVVSNPDATDALVRLDADESDGNMLLGGEIVLLDDLHLHLEATKRPFLAPVDCHIPALDKDARSLNEAYTLISTEYETWRRSHSGNAFRKILWRDERGTRPRWRPLDDLRMEKQALFERQIFGEHPPSTLAGQ